LAGPGERVYQSKTWEVCIFLVSLMIHINALSIEIQGFCMMRKVRIT
jgi:hypothetical protein